MKKCTKCGAMKDRSEFYVQSSGYPAGECKECSKARMRIRYYGPEQAKILAQGRKYASKKRAQIRDAAFAAYGGYRCACCGETEPKFMTLDHIKNDGAKFRKSVYPANKRGNTAGYHTYYWLARNKFPAGFQVLCMNCNYGKRMNGGVCPHETRCNDYPQGVGSSDPKRIAPELKLVKI